MSKVAVNYRLPGPLVERLRERADQPGTNATEIVTEALERYLADDPIRRPKTSAWDQTGAPVGLDAGVGGGSHPGGSLPPHPAVGPESAGGSSTASVRVPPSPTEEAVADAPTSEVGPESSDDYHRLKDLLEHNRAMPLDLALSQLELHPADLSTAARGFVRRHAFCQQRARQLAEVGDLDDQMAWEAAREEWDRDGY